VAGTVAPVPKAGAARRALLDAAERLFASEGIDGVSLREVTHAAGLGNAGAVHYYFGGRDALLEAVLARRRAALDARRDELLDAVEADGEPTAERVVAALVRPLVELLDDPSGRAFLSIQAQHTTRPRDQARLPRPLALRVRQLLGVPARPGPAARLRSDFAQGMVFTALASRAAAESAATRLGSRAGFEVELVQAATRVLTAAPAGASDAVRRAPAAGMRHV
jgi:AcrR family transcriptional regulator